MAMMSESFVTFAPKLCRVLCTFRDTTESAPHAYFLPCRAVRA